MPSNIKTMENKTAKTKGIDIQCIVMDELNNINNLDISVLLSNLLDNAIKFSHNNYTVISCQKQYKHSFTGKALFRERKRGMDNSVDS